jgi:hypothetical protein
MVDSYLSLNSGGLIALDPEGLSPIDREIAYCHKNSTDHATYFAWDLRIINKLADATFYAFNRLLQLTRR